MLNWRAPILTVYDARISHNPIPRYSSFLSEFYSWPIARQREAQRERLSQLLLHAARNVPHYRDVLTMTGVVHGDHVDLERFRHVPELTRDMLRAKFELLKSDDLPLRAWHKNSSGGSSGEPVSLLQDRYYDDMGQAATEMHYSWAGKVPGEPFVKLWGSDRDVLFGTVGWRNKLSNFMRNRAFLNSFDLSRQRMQNYARVIQRVRPVIIEAYSESIYELARYINAERIKLPPVRSVVTSAGTLYPFIREEVTRAFNCPVLNRYGSREVGNLAGEREAGAGMEVFTYTHFVEVVDDAGEPCGPGEEGDLLVTCLTNYAMPIIRYRIGDRAVVGDAVTTPTPSLERLATVTGRITDAFVREDGSTIPGNFFIHFVGVVHNSGWLRKTQIIQQDYNMILVKMVLSAPPPEGTLEEIRSSLQRVTGSACQVTFEFVDAIPKLASGKYRYTVSLVPRPSHGTPAIQ
ncbi:phenylacetate--CoA ligase family protein [Rhizobium sp. ARZ01]|uniref:phenylacetate--CoA ligase family protein n=1 Tax=Rhizobium sp. ARZ01 TaxID=2769313 RepID=UPI001782E6C6|nr:phenylacetate--CoA ligase family protein [Rhizobium sp. ARZ01]MBD9375237.1 phenylacetate--CoA ligase family protein [Rhizobium sp. ARZ01]